VHPLDLNDAIRPKRLLELANDTASIIDVLT